MKISVDWLNTYLDSPQGADDIDRVLTDQGLPIESRSAVDGPGNDYLLDVEVTSNRADCLSHVGLARDVAAGIGCKLVLPDCSVDGLNSDPDAPAATVANDDPRLCPYYTARTIRGVSVGPSPSWLVRRLESVGQRSINNVVDITNFVLLELGQPLHAFDLALLDGHGVVIRRARGGESLETLDGTRCKLQPDRLVIADGSQPVALAGVMGGAGSSVTTQTKDILLESAWFDPVTVRRSSRALKLTTDSSFRFERGVDPQGVAIASDRAARLICQLAGGQLAGPMVCQGEPAASPRTVQLRPERCNRLLGLRLTPKRMIGLLQRLGFSPTIDDAQEHITCLVPTRRLDVQREVDLIEEVARLHGLDAIPVQQKIHIVTRPPQQTNAARRKLNQVLVAHGYHEAITFSFINPRLGQRFVPQDRQPVMIEDPQRKADSMLRPSLLASLLSCRKSNQDVGNEQVHLYECAAAWTDDRGSIIEHNRLALLADAADPQLGVRAMHGVIGELIAHLTGVVDPTFVPVDTANFAPAASVQINGTPLGTAGLIEPSCQSLFELQTPVVAAELDLPALLSGFPPPRHVEPLPKFPGIERDLSVIVDETTTWNQIQSQVTAAAPDLMENLVFIGIYRGKPIPRRQKSVSFRLFFRHPTKTLRHEHVDTQVSTVIRRLESHLGAQLRG